jgi:4-hydroxy-2-oxoheptanedioate aldolase
VENAEAIYGLPGVDAIFVGPNDLRAQMRKPGGPEIADAELEGLLDRVVAAGKKVGTPTGMHVMDPLDALARAKQGLQFIAVGSELRMMSQKGQEFLAVLRPEEKGRDVARY